MLLRRADLSDVGAVLRQVYWLLLPPALLMLLVSVFLKGERWSVAIAAGSGERPRQRIFAATMIGRAANVVLPARLGDVLRAMVLRKHNRVSATRALFASWSAQSFDLLAVALLLLAGAASGKGIASEKLLAFVIAIVLAAVAAIGALARRPHLMARCARWLPGGPDGKIPLLVRPAAGGLRFLGEPAVLVRVASYTAAVRIAEVAAMWRPSRRSTSRPASRHLAFLWRLSGCRSRCRKRPETSERTRRWPSWFSGSSASPTTVRSRLELATRALR